MTEWEYTAISLSDLPLEILDIDVLNDAGKEGWELIIITANHIAYLKRQIEKRAHMPTPANPSTL